MQQINLYLPEFRPNREPFRAVHLAVAIPVLLIFLIVMSVGTHFKAEQLTVSLMAKQQQLKKLQDQLQVIKANKPADSGQSIDAQLQTLESKLQNRQQILSMVTREDFGNMQGFSAHLKGFGDAALPDVALKKFTLSAGGTYVEFSGETRSASLIPEYIQRLRASNSFKDVRMGIVEIKPAASAYLQFSVNNPKRKKMTSVAPEEAE